MPLPNIQEVLPSTCKVTIPTKETALHDVVSRWSDSGVSLPHAVVTPTNEDDIHATIKYAVENGLKIIPTNGGHGSFVPINGHTTYLHMSHFKTITLNEEKGEVRMGGGCVTKEVVKALGAKGWYTCLPNANAVGVIGAFLGGLSHSLNGKHGFGIDHVRSIDIIPFSTPQDGKPNTLTITPRSTGEEGKLFDVLCGAGHGWGVVTNLTLKAWRIADLRMKDDKIWTRRLMFPAPTIQTAAELYTSLLPPPPELTCVLAFLRAPPTAPVPGAPMIMLAVSYFGPAEDAEKAVAKTFDEGVLGKTIMNVTAPTAFENLNDGVEALNAHGGFKEYHGCFCKEIDAKSIVTSFESWKSFTDADPKGRGRSYLVIGSWSTDTLQQNASETGAKFFSARDRGVFVQATPWYAEIGTKAEADVFGQSVVKALREKDVKAGRKKKTFVNNLIAGQDMGEVYTGEQMREIARVKGLWDASNIGWNPVVEGWP